MKTQIGSFLLVPARGAAYNPYTGTSAAGRTVSTPYGSARQGAAYNPYTGARAAGGQVNPPTDQQVGGPLITQPRAREPRAAMPLGPTAALAPCAPPKAAVWPPGTPRTDKARSAEPSRAMSMRRKTGPFTGRIPTGTGRKTRVAAGRAPLSPSPAPTAAVPAPVGSPKPIPIRSHQRRRKAARLQAV